MWYIVDEKFLTHVRITEAEEKLFAYLNRVVNECKIETTMRIAGGWVRDKILGGNPHDIDISLDNMTGKEFGLLLKQKLEEPNVSADPDFTGEVNKKRKLEHRVAVIEKKPELGKFVETATIHLFGFSLDILSLRSQFQVGDCEKNPLRLSNNFLNDSSILKAIEDAHLRDLTINALFYNINKGCFEDFVNGVEDLHNKVLRCPDKFYPERFIDLENNQIIPTNPFHNSLEETSETKKDREIQGSKLRLMEDPLRSLRAIRFAGQLGFSLSEQLKSVINSEEVRLELQHKTAEERITTELYKLLNLHPITVGVTSFNAVQQFNLLYFMFPLIVPVDNCFITLQSHWSNFAAQLFDNNSEFHQLLQHNQLHFTDAIYFPHKHELEQPVLLLLIFFLPLFGENKYQYANGSHHPLPFTRVHMKDHWKYSLKQASDLFDCIESAYKFLDIFNTSAPTEEVQLKLGHIMRGLKGRWDTTFVCAIYLFVFFESTLQPRETPRTDLTRVVETFELIKAAGFLGKYGKFVWEIDAAFSGTELTKEFGVPPGKGMGVIKEKLLEYRMLNMDASKEQTAEWLRGQPCLLNQPAPEKSAKKKKNKK